MSRQQIPKIHTASIERILQSFVYSLRAPLSFVSFWSAIALPAVYLPFAASGIETTTGLGLFFSLVGLHLLALLGGHRYQDPVE